MIAVLVILSLISGPVSAYWSVTFEEQNPCAAKGSSVEFKCTYDYKDGETVHKTAWYKGQLKNGVWTRVNLSELPSYQNRSEYLGDQLHNCNLALHDLQENDTGYYYFRFDTETYGWHSKKSVYLSITELKASVQPDSVRVGDNVTLDCRTSCQLPGIVWFKDGRPVTGPKFQAHIEDTGNYTCAVKGQESVQSDPVALDVQYLPLNVSVEVSYAGNLTGNNSVHLICSSNANPAADNYTWFRAAISSFSSKVLVGSGQVLSIPSMKASYSGLYLCQATNLLGGSNSTEVLLTVDDTNNENKGTHLILLVGSGVKVVIVLLLTLVIIWAWQRRSSHVDKEENSPDYENFFKNT